MLKTIKDHFLRFSKAPFFSSEGFFIRGVEISLIFLILHIFGCKKYVGVLFGTTFSAGITPVVYFLRLAGLLYGVFYFAFLFLAPIFFIATGIFMILERIKILRKGKV